MTTDGWWTRLYIVSAATLPETLPDADLTAARLLRNQEHIGRAVALFSGSSAGAQLTTLLKEHIATAVEIITAAKAGDMTAQQDATDRWYANANAIADFLAAANPRNWPQAEMRAMMKEHLDLTLDEAVARLQGRFADDIAAYDRVHAQILKMADMLPIGIVRQFPNRFRGRGPADRGAS